MKLKLKFIASTDNQVKSDCTAALLKDDRIIAVVYHDYYAAMFSLAERMRCLLVAIHRMPCGTDSQNRHADDCARCAASRILLDIDLEEARLLGSRPLKNLPNVEANVEASCSEAS
jgi:hypothetical protein